MLRAANNRPLSLAVHVALFLLGAVSLGVVLAGSAFVSANPGDALTRNTVRLALAWYFAALVAMIFANRRRASTGASDGAGALRLEMIARWCWTWGCVAFLLHLATAMNYFYGWSQAAAIEETRRISGVGEGLYVTYSFLIVYAADTLWWWLGPSSRDNRPLWLSRALHGFMLFIVFNGAIIYEAGPTRWASIAAFLALGWLWWTTRPRAVAA